MEFKSYFKKFGKGWITVGIVLTFLLAIINYVSLSNDKYVIENAAKFGKSVPEFMISFWLPDIIFMSILLGFMPFTVGFFGFIRIFWLMIGWLIVYFLIGLLEGGSVVSYGAIFTIPLLILVLFIGIIWEIIHHYHNKSVSK